MRPLLWILAALALVAGAALYFARGDGGGAWTTESATARQEFEAGLTAMDKLYHNDALAHFGAAVEADPGFLMPKVWLITIRRYSAADRDEIQGFIEDLRAADVDSLTPRERMLVRHVLALVERDYDAANRQVEEYLAEHPDDPFGVRMRCGRLWEQRRWDEARACYQRLAELAPNQIEAQNRLGYIDMAQGRFEEAEAQFEIYGYLAPDQANPHDSMGELMMVTGRFDEAEEELRRAVALKPDFCASWSNLISLEMFRGDFAAAGEVLAEARAADGCAAEELDHKSCALELWRRAAEADWQAAWEASRACGPQPVEPPLAYLAAAAAGDDEALAAQVEKLRADLGEGGSSPYLEHLQALQALRRGDPLAAAGHGRAADEKLRYWSGEWGFKLHNRHLTAIALERAGLATEAAELAAEVAAVNPRLVEGFPIEVPPLEAPQGLPAPPPPAPPSR